MTIPDAIVAMIVEAIPGAYLWEQTETAPPVGDLVVFDGIVPPTPPHRYVAVYVDDGTRMAGQVAPKSTGATFRWQTTCVAPDRQAAGWLADRVKDGLVDARPVVDEWDAGLVEHTFSQLPQRDEQVLERPVVFAIDQFRLHAERLTAAAES